MSKTPHDLGIETLRGFAMLMVVFIHLTHPWPGFPEARPTDWTAAVNELFRYIRLPLFTAIAGWAYAVRPARRGAITGFLGRKAIRVLVPYAVATCVYVVVEQLVSRGPTWHGLGILRFYLLYPYLHLWYLPVLFLMFVVAAAFDAAGCMNRPATWFGCLTLTAIAAVGFDHADVFHRLPWHVASFWTWNMAVYLMPFFVLGCGVRRFDWPGKTHRRRWIVLAAAIALTGLAFQIVEWKMSPAPDGSSGYEIRSLQIWVGLGVSALLLALRRPIGWLAVIGNYTYTIYLYHVLAAWLVWYVVSRMFLPFGNAEIASFVVISGAIALPLLAAKGLRQLRSAIKAPRGRATTPKPD